MPNKGIRFGMFAWGMICHAMIFSPNHGGTILIKVGDIRLFKTTNLRGQNGMEQKKQARRKTEMCISEKQDRV